MNARQLRIAAYALAIASVPLFVVLLAAGRLWIGVAAIPLAIGSILAAASRREAAEHEAQTRGKHLWACNICGHQSWEAWHADPGAQRCRQCGGGQLELQA